MIQMMMHSWQANVFRLYYFAAAQVTGTEEIGVGWHEDCFRLVIWDDYYCDAIGDDLVCWGVFGGVDDESRGDHDYVYDQVLTSLTALERG